MPQLTPSENTVAGQELIQRGREEGLKQELEKGLEKGELVGEIHMALYLDGDRYAEARVDSDTRLDSIRR